MTDIFLIFSRHWGLTHHENCLEMSNPIFGGKSKKKYFKLSSAVIFTQHEKKLILVKVYSCSKKVQWILETFCDIGARCTVLSYTLLMIEQVQC